MMALDYEEDIDLINKQIHIHKNYDHKNNLVISSTKTGKSRTIYITNECVELIKQQIQLQKLKIIKHNLNRNIRFLFLNRTGKPVNLRDMNRELKKVGLGDKKISTHIFRHTFITYMVEAGVDKFLIANHVGNSVRMIDRVYSHFTNSMDQQLQVEIDQHKII